MTCRTAHGPIELQFVGKGLSMRWGGIEAEAEPKTDKSCPRMECDFLLSSSQNAVKGQIKARRLKVSLFLRAHHHLPSFPVMQSTDNVQSFRPFARDYSPPRSRTTAASIWAPQPQLLDATWPKAIDSFSRDAERELQHSGRAQNGHPFFASENEGQDVFGPVGLVGVPRKRDIGAIGDGRKKHSPDFDDSVSRSHQIHAHIC
jgi:hypothetical protein